MLGFILQSTGAIRKAAKGYVASHGTESFKVLSEPAFWVIVVIILICVGIYKVVKDDND